MTLPKTNLKQIERLLEGKPASAAYPVNLPLEILKQISRDLRATEKQGQSDSPNLGFAAPFLWRIQVRGATKMNPVMGG